MTEQAPWVLRIVLLLVLLVLGAAQATVGRRGLRGTLPRGWGAGVRTSASMRSEKTFTVANRVAGLPIMVGGLIAVFGAVLQYFMPDTTGTIVVAAIAAVGMVGITVSGGLHGHRVAASLPAETGGGCGGPCACGTGGCAVAGE